MKYTRQMKQSAVRGTQLLNFVLEEQFRAGNHADTFSVILSRILLASMLGDSAKTAELAALLESLDNDSGRARIREKCFKENKGKRAS